MQTAYENWLKKDTKISRCKTNEKIKLINFISGISVPSKYLDIVFRLDKLFKQKIVIEDTKIQGSSVSPQSKTKKLGDFEDVAKGN